MPPMQAVLEVFPTNTHYQLLPVASVSFYAFGASAFADLPSPTETPISQATHLQILYPLQAPAPTLQHGSHPPGPSSRVATL